MKTAREGGKNKQNQTQTKTLETNTIRSKSWINSLLLTPNKPAIVAIAAGFFMLLFLPGISSSLKNEILEAEDSSNTEVLPTNTISDAVEVESKDSSITNNQSIDQHNSTDVQSKQKNSTAVKLKVSVKYSNANSYSEPSQKPTLSINGQEIELPKNKSFNETFKDDNSKTRIRIRKGSYGNSSVRISTDTDIKSGGD